MAKGGNASFIVTASSVKKFLQQSEKSTACERLMGKARLHIPDFDNKQVKRRENQGAGAGSKIMLRGYAK
jgi:hypothetical protein|nr:MAG TPA: hypothetical protein [Caudoviricetes sp.]